MEVVNGGVQDSTHKGIPMEIWGLGIMYRGLSLTIIDLLLN